MNDFAGDLSGIRLGNYTLISLLGEGGFARVYLGEHVYLQRQAAIKVLHRNLTQEQIEAFQVEARNVARLLHPNIVQVLEYGVESEHNIPYLVMTYARATLRQLYPRGTVVPLPQVIAYVAQIADALYYAYNEFRLIHRDVKPENMLLGQRGELLLSDFGIAQVVHSSNKQAKMDVAGTIPYMAPEQVQGHPGPASDQYALAIVAYEWLCGAPPFRGSFIEIATQHLLTEPLSLRERGQLYAPEVEEVLRIGLAKDPSRRFANVRAFAIALTQASGLPRDTLPPSSQLLPAIPSLQVAPVQFSVPVQTPVLSRQQTPPKRPFAVVRKKRPLPRRAIVLGLGGLVVGSGVVVGIAVKLFSAPSSVSPSPSAGTTLYTYGGHQQGVNDLTWSPDGMRIASGGADNVVRVWDTLTGGHSLLYNGHTNSVTSVIWFPDGRLIASASVDGTIQVWDAATAKAVYTHVQGAVVQCIARSPDGTRIVSGDNNTILQVWDARTGGNLVTYTGHSNSTVSKNYIVDVAWSPKDERIASACDDETVRVWDGRKGQDTYVTYQHRQPAPMWAVGWSPDGKYIASGDKRGIVEVWDATGGKRQIVYSGHKDRVDVLAWSPSGHLIASAGYDNTVQVWRVSDGGLIYTYTHHHGAVYDVLWSPDGRLVASCGADQTAQVWQAPTG